MTQVRYYGVWPGVALGIVLRWRSLTPRGARLPAAIVTAALLLVSSMAWLETRRDTGSAALDLAVRFH
jgi:hypothetical protein